MARRRKQSISTFLVSALGFLAMCKAFLWIMEYQVLHVPINMPELNYAIIAVLVALLLRVGFVVSIAQRKKKVGFEHVANGPSSTSSPSANDLNMCVTCGKTVSDKVKQFCLSKPDRFQGQIYCFDHQSNHR
ncbi:hypothetical protein [Paenibacillus sp. RC67]|uniref:hypothetical protein n=1 Tax=Paenibacillus sp. RC67 TaxID=3039392 RepID=UPI0024AE3358|nr:hypothetical protein [Paenibacillus sp. RC67]